MFAGNLYTFLSARVPISPAPAPLLGETPKVAGAAGSFLRGKVSDRTGRVEAVPPYGIYAAAVRCNYRPTSGLAKGASVVTAPASAPSHAKPISCDRVP